MESLLESIYDEEENRQGEVDLFPPIVVCAKGSEDIFDNADNLVPDCGDALALQR